MKFTGKLVIGLSIIGGMYVWRIWWVTDYYNRFVQPRWQQLPNASWQMILALTFMLSLFKWPSTTYKDHEVEWKSVIVSPMLQPVVAYVVGWWLL